MANSEQIQAAQAYFNQLREDSQHFDTFGEYRTHILEERTRPDSPYDSYKSILREHPDVETFSPEEAIPESSISPQELRQAIDLTVTEKPFEVVWAEEMLQKYTAAVEKAKEPVKKRNCKRMKHRKKLLAMQQTLYFLHLVI